MMTIASARRISCGIVVGLGAIFAAPALAEPVAPKVDAADTAWMITATALVLLMSIPGLALFYAGMVRKKNVLATMAQTFASVALGSIVWVAIGYSLAFNGDGPWIGNLERAFLDGMGLDSISPAAKTIPEIVFMLYQMTFAVITVALVAGSVADRMRFSSSASSRAASASGPAPSLRPSSAMTIRLTSSACTESAARPARC
jgi:ammonium transporter, Amt family